MAIKNKSAIKHTTLSAQAELDEFNKQIKKRDQVVVGIPAKSGDYPDGTPVLLVALVHEFGSVVRNIPQRSFLRAGVRRNAKKYEKLFSDLAKSATEGGSFLRGLQRIGLQAQTDVRKELTDLKKPPLKHRHGNPLIDTGHLRQSITYEVRKK